MIQLIVVAAALVAAGPVEVPSVGGAYYDSVSTWDEVQNGPLPRWREGGTPPHDPSQLLTPRIYHRMGGVADAPTSGLVASPPEYSPSSGVLFRYSSSAWPTVVRDMVAALTGDPAHDDIAYVVVSSASQQSIATSQFQSAGADLSKVVFIQMPTDSIWLRDYGPHFSWQGGALTVVDSHYYPGRPLDNFIPTLLADDFYRLPSYDIGLYYSGGNFQPGPNRMGFVTSLINQDNGGFPEEFIAELYQEYQGIDTLVVFPRLPSSVDGTGHIDMWFYMVSDDTAIVSEFLPGENSDAITITDEAARYMDNDLGFNVYRVPDHNGFHPNDPQAHYTYTNAFRVNDRIFIPSYGQGSATHLARDAEALATWEAAAPDAEIIPIDCYDIIWAAGAIHCIVMQVPAYTNAAPSAWVVSPDGGELLVAGTTVDIEWAASDDVGVVGVDLYYSTDNGATFPYVISEDEVNDGLYTWTVPNVPTVGGRVKVVARDTDGLTGIAISESPFAMQTAMQHVYDFSSGAGVDKWAWGHQTISWAELSGVRRPTSVGTQIASLQSSAYSRIAASDATGTDSDPNRYRSPVPTAGRESTHVFEFIIEEDVQDILDIELLWEGYGDDCLQMELYVWDYVSNQWSNAIFQTGENRYIDNQAANRDAILSGHLRSDFDRYIGVDGMLTMLAYAERSTQESMHDYVAVTVTTGVPIGGIPAVSTWGAVALLLLLMVAATLVLARRPMVAR